jgi:AdoMet-dependent heme synthase
MEHRYERAPLMAYWEVTHACGLACRHCRADAVPYRDPLELSTREGERLLTSLAGFGERPVHLVLTGGDPLRRPDIHHLISSAVGLGIAVSVTPSGTPLLTAEAIAGFKGAGSRSLAFSLDGSTPDRGLFAVDPEPGRMQPPEILSSRTHCAPTSPDESERPLALMPRAPANRR